MKLPPQRLWEMLLEAAEAMGVEVRVEPMGETGTGGGACRVGGKWMILVDEGLMPEQKIRVLARGLKAVPGQEVYLRPAVRRLLEEVDA